MIDPATRDSFIRAAEGAHTGADPYGLLEAQGRDAARGDEQAKLALAAALARVAFVTPEAVSPVYDRLATGFLSGSNGQRLERDRARESAALGPLGWQARIPAAHWQNFFALVDDARGGIGAADITGRVVAFAPAFDASLTARVAQSAMTYPGIAKAVAGAVPPKINIETLKNAPEGSLGHAFYRLIVDNKFDVEVLDRDALGFGDLPAPLGYLNGRILQMHDIWHIVAGYDTTVLHEVGISAFQLAQFGHAYSAMFLATTAAVATLVAPPPAYPILMQTMMEAWVHGRNQPSFMGIAWESEWNEPIAAIRTRHNITPFAGTWPANLVEQATAPAAA